MTFQGMDQGSELGTASLLAVISQLQDQLVLQRQETASVLNECRSLVQTNRQLNAEVWTSRSLRPPIN